MKRDTWLSGDHLIPLMPRDRQGPTEAPPGAEGLPETRRALQGGPLSDGFGYDPVFLLPDRGVTTAELPPDEKNAVSHRGAAARKARAVLERWLREA